MANETVTLTKDEWTQIIDILARTPMFSWTVTNPLIQAIARQLQEQRGETHGNVNSQRSALVERDPAGTANLTATDTAAAAGRAKGRPGPN